MSDLVILFQTPQIFSIFPTSKLHPSMNQKKNSIFQKRSEFFPQFITKAYSYLILSLFAVELNIFRQIQIDFATINISELFSFNRFCLIARNIHEISSNNAGGESGKVFELRERRNF
jgi:hypothetical protein